MNWLQGIPLEHFEKAFYKLHNRNIAFKSYGFQSLEDLLLTMKQMDIRNTGFDNKLVFPAYNFLEQWRKEAQGKA